MERIVSIRQSVTLPRPGTNCFGQASVAADTDVVIVSTKRTAFCKAKRGSFATVPPEILLSTALKGVIEDSKINPALVQDVIVGNVLQPSAGALTSRIAQLMAMPLTAPVSAINRHCASGLEACMVIAAKIKAGIIDIGVGAGVESMSLFSMKDPFDPSKIDREVLKQQRVQNCLLPMGSCSEIFASRCRIDRKEVDHVALKSNRRAERAQNSGFFVQEIVPLMYETSEKKSIVVSQDDGIRKDCQIAQLEKIPPAFSKSGISTSGNSSQMTDGAAAVLLMNRKTAQTLGLSILGKVLSYQVVATEPEMFGVTLVEAIPKALQQANLSISDISSFEINEAFGSVIAYTTRELGLSAQKVNPNGGAISLGHALGATGARQIGTLLNHLRKTDGRFGVVSMCAANGMGAAAVFERE